MGSILGFHELIAHSDAPATAIRDVKVRVVSLHGGMVTLEYFVHPADAVLVPPSSTAMRVDGLWTTTCFEIFTKPLPGTAYREFNLSPSGQWAAYEFDDYRTGRRDAPLDPNPKITVDAEVFSLLAEFRLCDPFFPPMLLGVSAVIEEHDGTKSYWALAHPAGEPDFHNPACFILELASATSE